jgi:hypothetical protein
MATGRRHYLPFGFKPRPGAAEPEHIRDESEELTIGGIANPSSGQELGHALCESAKLNCLFQKPAVDAARSQFVVVPSGI